MDGPGKFLSTVCLVENIMGQRLQVSEMGASPYIFRNNGLPKETWYYSLQQSAPEATEVGVLGVVDLGNTPRIDPSTNKLTVQFNFLLRTDNGERHHSLSKKNKFSLSVYERVSVTRTRSSLLS